jgi:general secretion pathway protein G
MTSQKRKMLRRRARRGMTLIEIMVVLVILGMIMGAIGYNVIAQQKDASIRVATADVKAIANAVDMFQIKNSRLPETLDQLVPSEIKSIRRDPWGQPFVYVKSGDGYEVYSYGPDKVQGGGDDISSNAGAQAQR